MIVHCEIAGQANGDSCPVLKEMCVGKERLRIDGNQRGFDFTRDLAGLRVPTPILNGERDLISPESTLALYMGRYWGPGSKSLQTTCTWFGDRQAEFLARIAAYGTRSR